MSDKMRQFMLLFGIIAIVIFVVVGVRIIDKQAIKLEPIDIAAPDSTETEFIESLGSVEFNGDSVESYEVYIDFREYASVMYRPLMKIKIVRNDSIYFHIDPRIELNQAAFLFFEYITMNFENIELDYPKLRGKL